MAESKLKLIVQAVDQATATLKDIGKEAQGVANAIDKNWLKATAALGGAAIAIEAITRKNQPLMESSQRLAASLGMTDGEVRKLATSLSDATTPLSEVFAMMEVGRQQGIKSAEGLKQYASFWDSVGDATGENSAELAKAGTALRVVGIAAGNEGKAIASFGFLTENTTTSVSEFLAIVNRVGPRMKDMGMSVDQAAAVLGILEKEFGATGFAARTQLSQAITDAEGDMQKFLTTLKISPALFEKYQTAVKSSSGVIERNAKIQDDNRTVMQRLQATLGDVTLEYAPLIQTVSNMGIVMMAAGPVAKGISLAIKGVGSAAAIATGAVHGLSAAMAFLAGPAGWIVLAAAAAIAGGIAFYKFRDSIFQTQKANEWLAISFNDLGQQVSKSGKVVEMWAAGTTRAQMDAVRNTQKYQEELKVKTEQSAEKIKAINEQTLKDGVAAANQLGAGVMGALKSRYDEEGRLALDALSKQKDWLNTAASIQKRYLSDRISDLRDNHRESISLYESEASARIALINVSTAADIKRYRDMITVVEGEQFAVDRAERDKQDAARIEELRNDLRVANLSANAEAIQAANKAWADNERQLILRNDRENRDTRKSALLDMIATIQERATLSINEVNSELDRQKKGAEDRLRLAIENQTSLTTAVHDGILARITAVDAESETITTRMKALTETESLEAEARKLIIEGSQIEIIALLNSYAPSWQDAGKSFGENLIAGLNSTRASVQSAVNSILSLVGQAQAAQAALSTIGPVYEIPRIGGAAIIPGAQAGGKVSRSGAVMVGERGPELLRLPRAAEIVPLSKAGGQSVVNVTIVNHGAIGITDLDQHIYRAIRDGKRRGAFQGVLA